MSRAEAFKEVLAWVFERAVREDVAAQAERVVRILKSVPDMDLFAMTAEIREEREITRRPRFNRAPGARPFFKYWIGDDVGEPIPMFGLEVVMNDGQVGVADISLAGLYLDRLEIPEATPTLDQWIAAGRPVYERPGVIRGEVSR
jgi:hypothetical protein